MIQAIKKQIRLQIADWMIGGAVVAGLSIFGMILAMVIMNRADERECFELGTFMAVIGAVIFCIIMTNTSLEMNFNLQISAGQTRKRFFVSYYAAAILAMACYLCMIIGINELEKILYEVMFRGYRNVLHLKRYLIVIGIPAVFWIPAVTGFCGTLILKFGGRAGWIIYALWMFVMIGAPRIADATEDAPESVFGRIGIGITDQLHKIPGEIWLICALVSGVGALIGSYRIIMKQRVTI